MSYIPARPTVNYVPLAPVAPIEEDAAPATPSVEEAKIMCRASKWVIFLATFQLVWSVIWLLGGGILPFAITLIFTTMGLHGVRRQSPKLLTAHFAFSIVLYFLSIFGLVLLILYANPPFWVLVATFFVVLIQAIGIRHSRVLIQMTRKYNPTGALPTQRRCCRGNSCSAVQTQTSEVEQPAQVPMVQFTPQTPTAPLVPPPAYAQQQFFVVPQQGQAGFYPMPMTPVIRYPNFPQAIPVMPSYMQQPQEVNSNLYPAEVKQI